MASEASWRIAFAFAFVEKTLSYLLEHVGLCQVFAGDRLAVSLSAVSSTLRAA